MTTYNADSAECLVFTFKEGLLSPMAHDLKVMVTSFRIDVDDATRAVNATFDTSSLKVVNPMKDGKDNPQALSDADKQKIAGQIREDVLHASKFPEAIFRSSSVSQRADGGYDIQGELTLHGVTKPLSVQSHSLNGRQVVELTLHQPDFGIAPYKAMMGTLKVQADLKLKLTV
jgi:polyisoprenoid-binding protein YceI